MVVHVTVGGTPCGDVGVSCSSAVYIPTVRNDRAWGLNAVFVL